MKVIINQISSSSLIVYGVNTVLNYHQNKLHQFYLKLSNVLLMNDAPNVSHLIIFGIQTRTKKLAVNHENVV